MKIEKLKKILNGRSKNRFTIPKTTDECNAVIELSSDSDIAAYIALSNCANALIAVVEAAQILLNSCCEDEREVHGMLEVEDALAKLGEVK